MGCIQQNIKKAPPINTKTPMPTHGLLAEDYKQNLLNLFQNHKLDIQTKAIIMESVLLAANMAAKQQTQLELSEYNKSQEKTSEENLTNNPIETEQGIVDKSAS